MRVDAEFYANFVYQCYILEAHYYKTEEIRSDVENDGIVEECKEETGDMKYFEWES